MNKRKKMIKLKNQEIEPIFNPQFMEASPSDAAELLELHNLCHCWDQWPLERMEQVFSYELPVKVIRQHNKIIGLLIYLICLDEVRIINLAIHPRFRHYQLATQLIDNLIREAYANNWRYILLDVRKSNLAAINLYTKLGFEILCSRKDFYNLNPPIEDAYFMQLQLFGTQPPFTYANNLALSQLNGDIQHDYDN